MTSRSEEPKYDPGEGYSSRRKFLSSLSILLGMAGSFLLAVPIIGFIMGPLLKKPPHRWISVGPEKQFNTGETVRITFEDPSSLPWAGVTGKTGGWLRRESQSEFIVFLINCTHMGCPVRWEAEAKLFMCPCHGGVYYSDGKVAGGPPPRPLYRYKTRIHNGDVQIQTRPLPIT